MTVEEILFQLKIIRNHYSNLCTIDHSKEASYVRGFWEGHEHVCHFVVDDLSLLINSIETDSIIQNVSKDV